MIINPGDTLVMYAVPGLEHLWSKGGNQKATEQVRFTIISADDSYVKVSLEGTRFAKASWASTADDKTKYYRFAKFSANEIEPADRYCRWCDL